MGTITNIRKAFSYTNEGTNISITSSNGMYDPTTGRLVNFNGQLQSVGTSPSYVGDFSYSELDNGRISISINVDASLNINVDASLYSNVQAHIMSCVTDIKSQLAEDGE